MVVIGKLAPGGGRLFGYSVDQGKVLSFPEGDGDDGDDFAAAAEGVVAGGGGGGQAEGCMSHGRGSWCLREWQKPHGRLEDGSRSTDPKPQTRRKSGVVRRTETGRGLECGCVSRHTHVGVNWVGHMSVGGK